MHYLVIALRKKAKAMAWGKEQGAWNKGHVDERSYEIPHSGRARTLRKTKDKSHKKKGTDRKEMDGWAT
jgi:hypothetical protein